VESAPGERAVAHVAELPGCFAEAQSLDDLPALLEQQLVKHRTWREAHHLPWVPAQPELRIEQVVSGPRPWLENGAGALFAIDRRLLTDEEYSAHLLVLACARADVLRAAHAIPRGAYDDRAPGSDRTVRETLLHLARTEEWLVSRLGRRVQVAEPDPLRRLVDVRAATLEHLARYDRVDRDLIFIPRERPSDDPEEMWTLRKFLRRLIEHELDHLEALNLATQHWSDATGLE